MELLARGCCTDGPARPRADSARNHPVRGLEPPPFERPHKRASCYSKRDTGRSGLLGSATTFGLSSRIVSRTNVALPNSVDSKGNRGRTTRWRGATEPWGRDGSRSPSETHLKEFARNAQRPLGAEARAGRECTAGAHTALPRFGFSSGEGGARPPRARASMPSLTGGRRAGAEAPPRSCRLGFPGRRAPRLPTAAAGRAPGASS